MANKVRRNIKPTNYVSREEREERKRKRNIKIAGIFMLAIMLLSVVGFALITGGGYGQNSNSQSQTDISFQQFTDPGTGQVFWGAIINREQFIFLDIEGFDDFTNMKILGDELMSKEVVNVYIDTNFTSSDAIYNIEKVLNAYKIPNSRVSQLNCNANTIVLTNENKYEGDCMIFEAPKGEESRFSEVLLYHIVK